MAFPRSPGKIVQSLIVLLYFLLIMPAPSGGEKRQAIGKAISQMPGISTSKESQKISQTESCRFLSHFKNSNGQQLMPLGFFAMVEDMRNVNKLKQLINNGVILCHKYSSQQDVNDALKDLDAANRAGIGVLQNLPSAQLNIRDNAFWRNHISRLASNSNISAWYLPEEVKKGDLNKLDLLAGIIRSIDKQQRPLITYIENSNAKYISHVADIVDVVVFGAYPTMTPWRPRADLKCRLDKAYNSGAKVVMASLEAIKHKGGFTRTRDVRFDAYLALISGAKGIMWYSYNQARQDPQLFDAVLAVARELNGHDKLGEVLLTSSEVLSVKCKIIRGDASAPPASAYENHSSSKTRTYDAIQWTARKHGGYLYVFAVNMNEQIGARDNGGKAYEVTASFVIVEKTAGTVEVLHENRAIQLGERGFVDTFQPLETHIYKIALQ